MKGFALTSQKIQLSENDVEKQCLDLLGLHGYWLIRLHSGRFKTADDKRWITGVDKGTPDWAAVKAPSFLMEVKRPGGKLSDLQRQKIREIETCFRLPIVVVDSVEELQHWLEGLHARAP
jgi:hypothetical protein